MKLYKKQKHIHDLLIHCIERGLEQDIKKILDDESIDFATDESAHFDEERMLRELFDRIVRRKRARRRWIIRAAASILLLFGISAAIGLQHSAPVVPNHEVCAEKGEKMLVVLADGTRIHLNADSKLIYPEKFTGGERRVKLFGEAFFEVAKDKSNPFFVDSYDMEIRVTGTKFDVKSYPEDKNIRTALYEGSVKICKKSPSEVKCVCLKPGDVAMFQKGIGVVNVEHANVEVLKNDWRSHVFNVQDEKLESVLKTMERLYGVSFKIKNPAVKSYTYNISCDSKHIDTIIRIMQTITPVRFKKVSDGCYEVR